MTLNSNVAIPEGPPLVVMARVGAELHVTVLHETAADWFWQQRRGLTKIHGCTKLLLRVMNPIGQVATQIQWQLPTQRQISLRRQ